MQTLLPCGKFSYAQLYHMLMLTLNRRDRYLTENYLCQQDYTGRWDPLLFNFQSNTVKTQEFMHAETENITKIFNMGAARYVCKYINDFKS